MAATAFALYNKAKKYIGDGTIQLATTALKMALHTSASNAGTATLSTKASVNNECSGGGYAAKALSGMLWTAGASAGQLKFDSTAVVFTAVGSSLVNWSYAVIYVSAGKVLCWSKLTTAQQTLTAGNTLTVTPNASGIFTMT